MLKVVLKWKKKILKIENIWICSVIGECNCKFVCEINWWLVIEFVLGYCNLISFFYLVVENS